MKMLAIEHDACSDCGSTETAFELIEELDVLKVFSQCEPCVKHVVEGVMTLHESVTAEKH